jgi:hypothetical protein
MSISRLGLPARTRAPTLARNALKDPIWQEFLGKGGPLFDEMHSTIRFNEFLTVACDTI